ncbi:MAG: sensor histidine kinase [Phycisphaerales bacterium JB064]
MPDRASEAYPAPALRSRGIIARTPLRLRITLWVVAIFTVVQVSLSLIIILYQRESLHKENERRLVEAAQAISEEVASDPDTTPTDVALRSQHLRWFGRVAAVDTNDSGAENIVGPFATETFDQLRAAIRDGHFGAVDEKASGQAAGFYYAAHPHSENERFILAVPISEANAPLRTIVWALMLLLPAGMAASGVSAWYVAALAVRPLRQMQHFAEELGADNVSQSLEMEDTAPELESLREELNQAMRRISEGYDAQARFLANVSHEIKTPIAVVRTEGEVLLASRPTMDELCDYTRTTVEEMDRLGRMVESFLLLTRVRQGKGSVQAQRHPANEILMEAATNCNAMARQYGVRIEPTLFEGEDEPQVEGNADLLNTALTNLVRNAIRFAPRDSAVRLACDVRHKRVIFRVRDYGPGVPEEVLDHLFEPFTQSADERRRGRGTGLGLQIAHGIAELHQGEVRVRNLKQGCEFSLRLRLVQDNPNQTPQDEAELT